jgi:hypothetical protein
MTNAGASSKSADYVGEATKTTDQHRSAADVRRIGEFRTVMRAIPWRRPVVACPHHRPLGEVSSDCGQSGITIRLRRALPEILFEYRIYAA